MICSCGARYLGFRKSGLCTRCQEQQRDAERVAAREARTAWHAAHRDRSIEPMTQAEIARVERILAMADQRRRFSRFRSAS